MSGAFHMPIRTISESNQREHWRGRSTRHQKQREVAGIITKSWMELHGIHTHPSANNRNRAVESVSLMRLSLSRLDRGNLAVALKSVQDGICDALGIDDGDPEIEWFYDQAPEVETACLGVLVEVQFKTWRRK